jgi:RNA polymerase sigma-70 factor (ECF subfamily)
VGKGAVEDLIQEVYMKLINNIKRFRSGNFDAWVFKIARNICIDYIRRSPKERLFALADEFTVHETPSMRLEKEEQSALLKKAIESLPIEQKEVFLLREEAGLSFKDIANIQGVSINTVLGRMHYALNNLRKILKGYLL